MDNTGVDYENALINAGFGKFHYYLLAICGMIYLNTAVGITIISFVLPSATCDFQMTSEDKGWLTAAPMLGKRYGFVSFKQRSFSMIFVFPQECYWVHIFGAAWLILRVVKWCSFVRYCWMVYVEYSRRSHSTMASLCCSDSLMDSGKSYCFSKTRLS